MTAITIRRALLSGFRQTASSSSPGAGPARRGTGLDRRHRVGAARAGLAVRDISTDGVPGDDGRPGQDAPPQGPWRPAPVRDDPAHVASMDEHGIGEIDLVIVNLYPFLQTVMKGADRPEIIEISDIGEPIDGALGAKNHEFVAIVTDPATIPRYRRDGASGGARRWNCASASPPAPSRDPPMTA